jgi:hypothetical protein
MDNGGYPSSIQFAPAANHGFAGTFEPIATKRFSSENPGKALLTPEPSRQRAQRVVGARLGRHAVAKEIWCDDTITLVQAGKQRLPRLRTADHAMNQEQHLAAVGVPVGHPVAMQAHVLHVIIRHTFTRQHSCRRTLREETARVCTGHPVVQGRRGDSSWDRYESAWRVAHGGRN